MEKAQGKSCLAHNTTLNPDQIMTNGLLIHLINYEVDMVTSFQTKSSSNKAGHSRRKLLLLSVMLSFVINVRQQEQQKLRPPSQYSNLKFLAVRQEVPHDRRLL